VKRYSFQFTVYRLPNPEPHVHFGGIFSTERSARDALARFVDLWEADPYARVAEMQVFEIDKFSDSRNPLGGSGNELSGAFEDPD
jgi:hypothetical protein